MSNRPVLVVEDDRDLGQAIQLALETHGHDTVIARDGIEALERVDEICPILLLLDIRLPRMGGSELARELRQRDLRIPIVLVTSVENPRRVATEVGAADVLVKPFRLAELLRIVSKHVEGS